MREHYATGMCPEESPAVGQHGRRQREAGWQRWPGDPPAAAARDAAPRGGRSSASLPQAGDRWMGISSAAKPAQAPQASLELKGISGIPAESSSPLFASSAPFCCSSASFCPLL